MKTIVIVGVGALGSHVVQFCRNLGVSIRVIDFDHVERKNTLSQFHAKTTVGKAKVLSIKQTMDFLWGVKIETIPHKLTADNKDQLLGKADLVVDCLDNAAARCLVQEFVRRNGVSCVHGALSADGNFGRVVWDKYFAIDSESGIGTATCEDGEHLPFIVLAAATVARVIQKYLTLGVQEGYEIKPSGAIRYYAEASS